MFVHSIFVIVLVTSLTPSPADDLSADQLFRFISTQQSGIRDVAFAFEGERKRLISSGDEKQPALLGFQGRYALRSDGATFQEIRHEAAVDGNVPHTIETILKGKGEQAQITPQWYADPDPLIVKTKAGPGSLVSALSPERFHYVWRFQSLSGPSDFGYKFLGWEDVDGHRCAHIEFAAHPGVERRVRKELWIDLERGAHPLRIRNTDGDNIVYEEDNIRLAQFALPNGDRVWFPVGGRYSEYHHKGRYTKEPAFVTTSYVLNDTILFNQGLGDGVFQVKGEPFRPQFQGQAETSAPRPVIRKRPVVDFAETEKKLDEALADQARTAQATDAAASTRDEVTSWSWIPWVAGIGGGAVLLAAGWIAWRGRG